MNTIAVLSILILIFSFAFGWQLFLKLFSILDNYLFELRLKNKSRWLMDRGNQLSKKKV